MSTERTLQITSTSLDETLRLAEQVGKRLRGGEVIEMTSDLGGGKTTFVSGIAKGLGVKDTVHSPSFTLSNEYQGEKLRLYHLDFYRLNDPGILRDELSEMVSDDKAVVAIEWADIVEDVLSEERLSVKLIPTGETSRQLVFTAPARLAYLFPNT